MYFILKLCQPYEFLLSKQLFDLSDLNICSTVCTPFTVECLRNKEHIIRWTYFKGNFVLTIAVCEKLRQYYVQVPHKLNIPCFVT